MINRVADFIEAASAPLNSGHGSGTLDQANAILAEHPDVATTNIYAAAILGDCAAIQQFLKADPRSAKAKGGPRSWDALTYLCFSRYLRLEKPRSDGFVRAARALLDAGADANTGWFENNHQPKPEWESVLYGAAGVAHHPELTRLLIERGADPNDEETPYHAPEGYDNRAMKVLIESGKLTAGSLAMMLVRKAAWHDYDGIKLLLEHGADPNRTLRFRRNALQHALLRDNGLEIIELMLQHGADPAPAIAIAARRGRSDVLELMQRRGIELEFNGVERLISACALNDSEAVRSIGERNPEIVDELLAQGGSLMARFAGTGNVNGLSQLLSVGVKPDALFTDDDGYWGIAPNSTALHVAAWRAQHDVVKLLIASGASVDALDAKGRTPLALAVRACVDSYWKERRSPVSVDALLKAGASVAAANIRHPSGYAEVDVLLAGHAAKAR